MGNREDLLDGAARCLREKGWARSTVRDIAAAAGVSHAAIGYHFGSREALLTAALVQVTGEWEVTVEKALLERTPQGEDLLAEEWTTMVETFDADHTVWRAGFDAAVQAQHHPALREMLADGQELGRRRAAAAFLGVAPDDVPEEAARTLGAVHNALIAGVMLQRMVDPDRAPSGADVAAGLRTLAELLASEGEPPGGVPPAAP